MPGASPDDGPLFLIGFMGSGKSTVGRMLARRLGWDFVDCDAVLTGQFGRSIASLFAAGREAEFRAAEATLIRSLADGPGGRVVATGGGACQNPSSAVALRQRRLVFWLDAPWPVLEARMRGDATRPLLADNPAGLYTARQPLYTACARRRLNAENSVDSLVAQIIDIIRE